MSNHVFSLEVCARTAESDAATTQDCADNGWDGTISGKEVKVTYASVSLIGLPINVDLAPAIVPGDFDASGEIDIHDIAVLISAILAAENTDNLDFENDGVVDERDLEILVNMVFRTYLGDANLDGVFDSQDLVLVFQSAEYEDGDNDNSTWSEGDWDGDGDFAS